jgi:hypothetical protein
MSPNSYAIRFGFNTVCDLIGEPHLFELPGGAVQPEMKVYGNVNVYGCGLVLDPENNLAIFFTLNAKLMGEFGMRELRVNGHTNLKLFH